MTTPCRPCCSDDHDRCVEPCGCLTPNHEQPAPAFEVIGEGVYDPETDEVFLNEPRPDLLQR
jgi:hypothetical protein